MIALEYGIDELLGGITGARERLADRRPALRAMGRMGVAQTKRRFQTKRAPDGSSWPPNRAKTELMIKSGLLVRSITDSPPDETGVAWGSNRVYAAIHQAGFDGPVQVSAHSRVVRSLFGRKVSPFRQNVGAHTRNMKVPARPYLGVNDADAAEHGEILVRYVAEGSLP